MAWPPLGPHGVRWRPIEIAGCRATLLGVYAAPVEQACSCHPPLPDIAASPRISAAVGAFNHAL